MSDERDLLYESLPVTDTDWAAFEARFLGRGPDCPPTGDLITLVAGEAAAPGDLEKHLAKCSGCLSWYRAFREGMAGPRTPPPVQGGSLLQAFSVRDGTPPETVDVPRDEMAAALPADPFSSMILTGVVTMFLAGRTEEALSVLSPFLPEMLQLVGLDPNLSGEFWRFIEERLRQSTDGQPAFVPDWLRQFARTRLQFPDLPTEPAPADWQPLAGRCALRSVQISGKISPSSERFLQAALDRGVCSHEGLNDFWNGEEVYQETITDVQMRRLVRQVHHKQGRVSRMFQRN